MSAELQPSDQSTAVTSRENPFVKQVLQSREQESESKLEQYYYQLGYLYASGILEKLYQWRDFQDGRILKSPDTSGRLVISVQWNFREVEGRKLCDEVGIVYICEIGDTPLLKYEAEYPEENGGYKQYYEEHKETADFFLVWGQKPKIMRYFPHGKVEEALQSLATKGEKFKGGPHANSVWDRMMIRDEREPIDIIDAVNIEKTEQEVKNARIESGKKFQDTLAWVLNNPKMRISPVEQFRSPFRGDFGENSLQLFDRFEAGIRNIELRDRIEEDRRLYHRDLTTTEQATAAFKSGAGYSYEQMLEQQIIEEAWDEEAEQDYSIPADHDSCRQDEETGYYSSEDLESHSHPQD